MATKKKDTKGSEPEVLELTAEPKRIETKTSKRRLRCDFTTEEKLDLGKQLAELTNSLAALQSEKAMVVADFGAKIKKAEAEIEIASGKVSTGYEYRQIPCTETFDHPAPGKKWITRDDTGEFLGTEDMSESEMQYLLNLEAEEKAKSEQAAPAEPFNAD